MRADLSGLDCSSMFTDNANDDWELSKNVLLQLINKHYPLTSNYFAAIKAVYGPTAGGAAPLLSANGTILFIEKTQILQGWAEHFRDVFNHSSTTPDAAIVRLPQVELNVKLDLTPSLHESITAMQQLPNGKAPRSDAIPAEIYEHGRPQLMEHLTALFQEIKFQGEVPKDLKDAKIVHFYRKKEDRQICDHHRGIFLLKITGKSPLAFFLIV
nr:unnamed protein product [Spirometra erinaceieuropaei]